MKIFSLFFTLWFTAFIQNLQATELEVSQLSLSYREVDSDATVAPDSLRTWEITWDKGVLQSSADLHHWEDIDGASSPYMVVDNSTAKFFRVRAYNILFLAIDDLRPELGCYGQNYISSPNIDALANAGSLFERHYCNSPSCGSSRYTLLTGKYGSKDDTNGALFQRGSAIRRGESVAVSLPQHFKDLGYRTVSTGKISHYPGGFAGTNWNNRNLEEMPLSWDDSRQNVGEWGDPEGAFFGLSGGQTRPSDPSTYPVQESVLGDDNTYPDGYNKQDAIAQLTSLEATDEPFFLGVGFFKPHLPFGAPKNYLDLYPAENIPSIERYARPPGITTWHPSAEFFKYNQVGLQPNEVEADGIEVKRHYAACVSYIDEQVGQVMASLDSLGLAEKTIVVLWGDHGYHLGEHKVWGKHTLFEESLHCPLIIKHPTGAYADRRISQIVETVDVFPTVCEMAGLPEPSNLDGSSLVDLMVNPEIMFDGEAIAYRTSRVSIRTNEWRMVVHPTGRRELYDWSTGNQERNNVAVDHPEVVVELEERIHTVAPHLFP